MESIFYIAYFVIGILIAWYYWNKDYKNEYTKLKENDESEDSMVSLLLMGIIFFWPLKFVYESYKRVF